MTQPRLCLVGAGAAGAGSAFALRDAPIDVTVLEKSRGVGGRAATRRKHGCRYDHGANYVTDDTDRTRDLLQSLDEDGLVTIDEPVWTFDEAGSIEPGDPDREDRKWTWEAGITQLAKRLFARTDATIEYETRVASIRERDGTWTLTDTDGDDYGPFDGVVLTPPAPQTADLLAATASETLGDELATLEDAVRNIPYRTIRTLVLHYPFTLEQPWYALVNADREHAIGWLAREECKPGHVPAGESLLIVQMSPDWSRAHYDDPLAVAADTVAQRVATLLEDDRLADPDWVDDQGWRYALPEAGLADVFDNDEQHEIVLGRATEAGLFVAGDWVVGERRVHAALWNGIETGTDIATRE